MTKRNMEWVKEKFNAEARDIKTNRNNQITWSFLANSLFPGNNEANANTIF